MSFLFTALNLLLPLAAGYLCVRLGWLRREQSKPIQRTTILLLAPPVTFLAMWGLEVSGIDILGVPLAAALSCLGGMGVAYLLARPLGLSRPATGAFIGAAGWSNTWLLGGYLSFVLFGRQGLALASFYNIPNMPIFYLVGFGVAGLFSPARQRVSLRGALRDFVTDPVSLLPNVSLLVGLGLNLAGVRPGAWIDSVNTYLVPTFTLFSMFAVGMTMTFRRTRDYVRPILGQAAIKYLFWPALTFALIYTLRGNLLHDPITYRVLVLQACMPVAMQAMLLSNLFDLDMDLVNALWLTTTLFSLVTAPLLIYALQL